MKNNNDFFLFLFLRYFKYTKPPKKSGNNAKKLFTVLGTLVAITIGAIILVILWYRVKAMFKRKQKKKKIIEQQKNFSIPSNTNTTINNNNSHSTGPRYASSEVLSSIPSTQLIGNNSQSQALIESETPPPTVYKNADALANDSIHSYIDEENQQQQPQQETLTNNTAEDIQAITEC